ncbi:type II toxin-antitoxin system VapB family antitoxin [Desulfonema magnum]|uniref:Toxin-antitoxin system type II, antitoxin component, VapB-like n=1 Tax=Desulfonema magnum TaxID=45655 RepID=A0A975BK47_9BACT|nr:type II toxin-antitoxin system VapB family antitoxin [Desulfonema magnum]QTA86762.1 Toxin-antitoxin system type II, antitoxin component, VapB-like [Desulfonema magnum]
MLTDIQINNELLEQAKCLGGDHTECELINKALEEYIRKRERIKILKYFGKFDFDPEYDYKEERRRR